MSSVPVHTHHYFLIFEAIKNRLKILSIEQEISYGRFYAKLIYESLQKSGRSLVVSAQETTLEKRKKKKVRKCPKCSASNSRYQDFKISSSIRKPILFDKDNKLESRLCVYFMILPTNHERKFKCFLQVRNCLGKTESMVEENGVLWVQHPITRHFHYFDAEGKEFDQESYLEQVAD